MFNRLVWAQRFAAALVLSVTFISQACAQLSPEVSKGLTWLQTQVQTDGHLTNEATAVATLLQSRAESLRTLRLIATAPSTLAASAAADTEDNTEYLARRLLAADPTADNSSLLNALVTRQNADGGFAAVQGYQSNALDTAWALLALKTAPSLNPNTVTNAVAYLVKTINADGSYSPTPSYPGDIETTAYSLLALQSYGQVIPLATQINLAKQWLVSKRGADGSFGTTYRNALCTLALLNTGDVGTYAGSVAAMKAAQLLDGSWATDPYLTALALRVLTAVAQGPTVPTVGQIQGVVIDATTSAGIAGAQIQVVELPAKSIGSAADGNFVLVDLAPGTYTLRVSQPGYTVASVSVTVSAGSFTNLGGIKLSAAVNTATLKGQIRDGVTGTPVVGVSISLTSGGVAASTQSVLTDAQGVYQFAGVPAGAATIQLSKVGYDNISATAQLVAGAVVIYSPTMYAPGTTPKSATLQGQVVDSITSISIASAVIKVGTLTAISDASGNFSLAGLTSGAYSAAVSATGYYSSNLDGLVSLGVNDAGTIKLQKVPTTTRISGVVTQTGGNTLLAGVTISIPGTKLITQSAADGSYKLEGVVTPQFSVVFSLNGYISRTIYTQSNVDGLVPISTNLDKSSSGGLGVAVTSAKTSYAPYADADFVVTLRNGFTHGDLSEIVNAWVVDAQQNVLAEIPARPLTLSQPLSAALITISPGEFDEEKLSWNTGSNLPGEYRFVVRVSTINGAVVNETSLPFSILAVQQIGGTLTLSPPITQLDNPNPVQMTAKISNRGNLPIGPGQVQLAITLKNPDTLPKPVHPLLLQALAELDPALGLQSGVLDKAGNYYVISTREAKVLKISPNGQVSDFIKPTTAYGLQDLAIDKDGNLLVLFPYGSLYYGDGYLMVSPNGTQTRINSNLAGQTAIDADQNGNVYITGSLLSNASALLKIDSAGVQTILMSNGISNPFGVVFDRVGNLFVANYGDGTVVKILPGGKITSFVSGLVRPQGMTIDAQDNLYVANSGENNVIKITPEGTKSVYASNLPASYDLKFDSTGKLYVSLPVNNSVAIVATDGIVSTFTRGGAYDPESMKYDGAGNLYIVNTGNSSVTKLDAANNFSIVATGLSYPRGLALNADGDLFVANAGNSTITKTSNGVTSTYATGIFSPTSIAADSNGTVYVAESNINRISTISPSGQSQLYAESPINYPREILVNSAGEKFVLNLLGISKFNGASNSVGNVLVHNLNYAQSFASTLSGGFIVLESGNVIKTIDTNGNLLATTNLNYGATAVVTDMTGVIYIADSSNNRINKYDTAGTSTAFAQLPGSPTALAFANNQLYALLNSGQIMAIDTSGAVNAIASGVPGIKLAVDASNKFYVTGYGGVSIVEANGGITPLASGLGYSSGIAVTPSGQVLVGDLNQNSVTTYNQGALVNSVYGFSNPRDMVWTNSELVFTDGNRIYSLVEGQNPQVLASVSAEYLAWNNGMLYFTQNGKVGTLDANGNPQFLPANPNFDSPGGIAIRADGAISLSNRSDSSVVTINATGQLLASYPAIITPQAIGVDANDNVYVATRNTLVKVDRSTNRASVFAKSTSARAMIFDPTGQLYLTDAYGTLRKIDPSGNNSYLSGPNNATGIALYNGGIYMAGFSDYKITVNNNNVLSTYATGMGDIRGVRAGNDGSIYIAGANTGTIQRFRQGALETFATGLTYPRSLAFGPSGNLYTAGGYGNLAQITPSGQVTDLKNELLINSLEGMTVDSSEMLYLTSRSLGRVYKATLPLTATSVAPTSSGTVVYTTTTALTTSLPIGGDALFTDFGNWKPIEGGDYDITVTSASGVAGNLLAPIHVGPHVSGTIGTSKTVLAPGQANIGAQVSVKGADFSDTTRVDTAGVSIINAMYAGTNFGVAADRFGNIYVAKQIYSNSEKVIVRYSATGQESIAVNGKNLMPGIAVDSKQNLYYTTFPDDWLIRLAPDGSEQLITALPSKYNSVYGYPVRGMAIDSHDNIMILMIDGVIKVDPDGSQSIFNNIGVNNVGYGVQTGLAIDGSDNLYVHNVGLQNYSNDIVTKISADGLTASAINSTLLFENEGFNISADCSNNVLASISTYYGQEGHAIVRVDGKTLRVSTLLVDTEIKGYVDIDNVFYDHFNGNILLFDDGTGRIFKLPLTCGGLGADLHMVFPAGQAVSGFNLAPTASIAKPDGSTEYVWNLKDVKAAGQDVRFDTTFVGQKLGDKRKLASEAYLSFKNTFVAGDIKVPLTIPELTVDNAVTLVVNTDKPGYATKSPVAVTVGVANPNAQTIAGTLNVELIDAAGLLVAPLANTPASLPANGQQAFPVPFNTGDIIAGAYRVRATLVDAQGMVQAQSFTGLNILSGNGSNSQLTTTVTADKTVYGPSDPVRFTVRLANGATNTLINNLRAVATIVNPAGATVFSGEQTIPQLGGGALRDLNFAYQLANAMPGVYTTTIKIYDELGTALATRTLNFTVSSTAVNGTGLLGDIAVLPKQVTLGDKLILSAGITNQGNTDLTGLNLKLAVVDPVTQTVLAQWPYTVNLIRGQRKAITTDWLSTGPAGSTLVAVISATVGGQDKVLAQDTFTLVQRQNLVKLDVTQKFVQSNRVLALVSCKQAELDDLDENKDMKNTSRYKAESVEKQDSEDGDKDQPACMANRASFVDAYLTSLGVMHKVVSNEADFRKEFRRGVYDLYWISGGAVKLKDTLAEELREAVYRGDGLMIDGVHDARNNDLDVVMGVRYSGKLTGVNPVITVLPASPVSTQGGVLPAGSYVGQGRGLKLTLAGATQYAKFDKQLCKPDEDSKKPAGDCPAIVGHAYGAGQAMQFGFDLADSLRPSTTDLRWKALFMATLSQLQPKATANPLPSGYVSFDTQVKNLGQPADVQVSVTVPTGSVVQGSVPAAQTDAAGHSVWRFNLPMDATQPLSLSLLAPPAAGFYRIETDVATIRNGQVVPYDHYGVDLQVTSALADANTLASDLKLLTLVNKKDSEARDKAVKALQQALSYVAQNKLENAIKSLLEASESLSLISVDVKAQRQRVDRLLQEIERKWFKALTP